MSQYKLYTQFLLILLFSPEHQIWCIIHKRADKLIVFTKN